MRIELVVLWLLLILVLSLVNLAIGLAINNEA